MRATMKAEMTAAAALLLCLGAAGCSKVSGHTYADSDGMVKIDFESGGKAVTSMGPITANCTYTESGKTITLTCADQVTQFTLASDGSLDGPPDGMLNHMTRVK